MALLHDAVLTKPTSYVTRPVSLSNEPTPSPSLPSTAPTPGNVSSLSATLSVASTAFVTVPPPLVTPAQLAGRNRERRYPSVGSTEKQPCSAHPPVDANGGRRRPAVRAGSRQLRRVRRSP